MSEKIRLTSDDLYPVFSGISISLLMVHQVPYNLNHLKLFLYKGCRHSRERQTGPKLDDGLSAAERVEAVALTVGETPNGQLDCHRG